MTMSYSATTWPPAQAEINRLKDLMASAGHRCGVHITVSKLYPASPKQGRHTEGHHVGSWSFVLR